MGPHIANEVTALSIAFTHVHLLRVATEERARKLDNQGLFAHVQMAIAEILAKQTSLLLVRARLIHVQTEEHARMESTVILVFVQVDTQEINAKQILTNVLPIHVLFRVPLLALITSTLIHASALEVTVVFNAKPTLMSVHRLLVSTMESARTN